MSKNPEGIAGASAVGENWKTDSLEFWKSVIDVFTEGVSVHSPTAEILNVNKSMLQIYGKASEEMVGRSCDEVFHVEAARCPHAEVLADGLSVEMEDYVRIGERIFKVTLRPIIREEGSLAGFLRIMEDDTERVREREQLLRAEQLATLGQMINGIAHDVGTPLNIISGYSEYLLMRTNPQAQGYNELSTILQQTRRITQFIRQMLDLSRPSQGRREAIDLKQFVADSLDLVSHHLRKSDVKARLESRVGLATVYMDAHGLRQAVVNLLLNACEKVGRGGGIDLEIKESGAANQVTLVIKGTNANGAGHDFSDLFRDLAASRNSFVGVGLSLASVTFEKLGVRIGLEPCERGVALFLSFPE
ncbi:MAG TPA: histidine kinase dimerization/phospho-acceptor domain-containing protein [Blastocatellia bacterium]|nr:histidine kinase dimerization/phospho-acceptor domain-containing protein [Blastocatellia bacterium]